MTLAPAAITLGESLIRRFEGCRVTPYQDVRGLWTIGWGNRTLGNGACVTAETAPLTQSQADGLLDVTLRRRVIPPIESLVRRDLSDARGGALLSLVWNIGVTAFAHSHVLGCINDGNMEDAGVHFRDWCMAAGRYCAGLAQRRSEERAIWDSG